MNYRLQGALFFFFKDLLMPLQNGNEACVPSHSLLHYVSFFFFYISPHVNIPEPLFSSSYFFTVYMKGGKNDSFL